MVDVEVKPRLLHTETCAEMVPAPLGHSRVGISSSTIQKRHRVADKAEEA